ncbi:DUF3025 domain-containing protein [Amantichitinum ursilacus]|uniref:DUF3025 domain-containing protein n=1 Tax=Amantichitinum ursilacus TaxID=857265 RepID=A0A0N0XKJ3_9NEIS|nr:DUF3025 domain-containing protein [Amantichitinum ursilacus]KPC54745.1 hypothetical protein WG78_04210 [Amantichitinum ursilacus]
MPAWPHPQFAHPAFAPLRAVLASWATFPDLAQLSADVTARTERGLPVQFVPQDSLTRYYEAEVYELGRVATRAANWHDLFNALMWRTWPRSKAALNALHYTELQRNPDGPRGPQRDAATLFDECGLVIAYSDPDLLDALVGHQWHALFRDHANAWGTRISALCFGHATLESLLEPFAGLTAKCWPVQVEPAWFMRSPAQQIAELDQHIAAALAAGELQRPRQLPPLPYLGIPGWWPQQDEAFYADTQYFRPKRIIK